MPVSRSHPRDEDLPTDPDGHGDGRPWQPRGEPALPAPTSRVLAVVAAGGILGSLARYGLALALPAPSGTFPWATFLANVSGSLLLGLLLVILAEVLAPSRYLRPFLGVGVLGGYTTFSAYTSDARSLLAAGHGPLALAYVFGTLAACLLATVVGVWLGRLLERRAR